MNLTNAEQILLSLLAEKSRHGYELEQIIQERGVREWTELGFSSIYYLLAKLETKGLAVVHAEQNQQKRSRKIYTITEEGCQAAKVAAEKSLIELTSHQSPLLAGLANSPFLPREKVIELLEQRKGAIDDQIKAIGRVRDAQPILYDFAAAMFDYNISQYRAEQEWCERTIKVTLQG